MEWILVDKIKMINSGTSEDTFKDEQDERDEQTFTTVEEFNPGLQDGNWWCNDPGKKIKHFKGKKNLNFILLFKIKIGNVKMMEKP